MYLNSQGEELLLTLGVAQSTYFMSAPRSLALGTFWRSASSLLENLSKGSFHLPCTHQVALCIKASILQTLVS